MAHFFIKKAASEAVAHWMYLQRDISLVISMYRRTREFFYLAPKRYKSVAMSVST